MNKTSLGCISFLSLILFMTQNGWEFEKTKSRHAASGVMLCKLGREQSEPQVIVAPGDPPPVECLMFGSLEHVGSGARSVESALSGSVLMFFFNACFIVLVFL